MSYISTYKERYILGIIYILSYVCSLALRLSRICSYRNDFEKYLEEMKSWVLVRSYPDNLVKKNWLKYVSLKVRGVKARAKNLRVFH